MSQKLLIMCRNPSVMWWRSCVIKIERNLKAWSESYDSSLDSLCYNNFAARLESCHLNRGPLNVRRSRSSASWPPQSSHHTANEFSVRYQIVYYSSKLNQRFTYKNNFSSKCLTHNITELANTMVSSDIRTLIIDNFVLQLQKYRFEICL